MTNITLSNRIDALVDELVLINECLHSENVDRRTAAYSAFLDFQGDINAIATSKKAIVSGDFLAAMDLLHEITKGYYVDRFAHQFVLDW